MPTATLLTSSFDNVDRTSYTTASVSPSANRWLVVDCYSRQDTGPATPTVSGLSLTWVAEHTKIDTAADHVIQRAYANTGGSPGSGIITINYGATHVGCAWVVYELSADVDASDPFVQTVSNELTIGATQITVTLAAFGSANNRPLIMAFHRSTEVATPEAGYTEIGDVNGTLPAAGVAVAIHETTADTTPTYSWTTSVSPSLSIASEVKAAAGGGGGPTVSRRTLLGVGV
jgi:hypothetical protein